MDIRKLVLYAALTYVIFSLWNAWQADYHPEQAKPVAVNSVKDTAGHLLPTLTSGGNAVYSANDEATSTESPSLNEQTPGSISVTTDVLKVQIDNRHGDIVKAALVQYPQSTVDKQIPFTLLDDSPANLYVANSSLIQSNGQQTESLALNLNADKTDYQLSDNEQQLQVVLRGETEQGLKVNKIFTFTRGSYLVDLQYQIENSGEQSWKGYLNTQLLRREPTEDKSSIFHIGSFTGASYSVPGQHKYQKVGFDQMAKANLNVDSTGGWVAMQQHYFLTAWIPTQDSQSKFYTLAQQGDYTIGAVSQPLLVEPGQQKTIGAQLYTGPEITDVLKDIAPGLDMTIDYGWLWFLSSLLFSLMKTVYRFVGNWGWSIVIVTVLIKLAFYRLSATSYKSMAGMRRLQPKLQALKERYGDDKAKITQETMALYKEERVNPLGGCLPIIVQIPVFIALYWVLLESVELRQAPFILWIQDLASADPYHVLPIIMGATMLIQQKLNPAPPDPVQAKMMMLLPIVFTALFWNFPSGLVLYWIVNNTLSILQQWYITNKYSDEKPSKKLATA